MSKDIVFAQTVMLMKSLREILKEENITYKSLVERSIAYNKRFLNDDITEKSVCFLNEATLRSMFTRGPYKMDKIEYICNVIGITLFELFERCSDQPQKTTKLDSSKEEKLVSDPMLLQFAVLVINRIDKENIRDIMELSDSEYIKCCKGLNDLGVIAYITPEDNNGREIFNVLFHENFSWIKNGPVEKYFIDNHLQSFVDGGFDEDAYREKSTRYLYTGMLSEHSIKVMSEKLIEVEEEFQKQIRKSSRDSKSKRINVGLMFAMRPWKFKVKHKI